MDIYFKILTYTEAESLSEWLQMQKPVYKPINSPTPPPSEDSTKYFLPLILGMISLIIPIFLLILFY